MVLDDNYSVRLMMMTARAWLVSSAAACINDKVTPVYSASVAISLVISSVSASSPEVKYYVGLSDLGLARLRNDVMSLARSTFNGVSK